MIAKMIVIMMAFMPFTVPLEAALLSNLFSGKTEKPLPPTIKILLTHDREGVVLEVKGKYRLYDPLSNDFITNRLSGKRSYIQTVKNGLKWGEGFPGLFQLKIVPDSPSTTIIVDGIEYRGMIYVYDVEGKISIVNELDIEEYLRTILSNEVRNPLPEEAIAAIVIAARTNTYYQVKSAKNLFWHIEAKQAGYLGFAASQINHAIEQAIAATRYMALEKDSANELFFPAEWQSISLSQASETAKKGGNAADILKKTFPKTSIQLVYGE